MECNKILIISAGFYPQNSPRAFRTTELAKELSRQGHDVVVYIPFRGHDYTEFGRQHGLTIKDLGQLKYRPIEIGGGFPIRQIKRLLRRSLGLLFEYPSIEYMFKVAQCLKQEKGYDLLISVAVPYPIHWGVAKRWSRKKQIAKTWVADCGDPFMGVTADTFRKPFYFKFVEKWFCRKADFISIPFDGARIGYYPEFEGKLRIIPQGFNLDNMNLPVYEKKKPYVQFAYAGSFIPGKRDPGAMLDFLTRCNRDFRFVLYTPDDTLLRPFMEQLGEKLIIKNYIPRDELLKELASMDFLVNFDNNTPSQLPSKLIDYAITDRPVFNVTASTQFNLLHDFMDGNYEERMQLDPAENFNIRNVAASFVRLYNEN